ncbi:MAG TPA: hypothetical protein DDZ44_08725 [Syntrophomonas wolfei]|uniref:DUF4367 domain-containing protein n=2 Tax=Syntrophomonas wolfei TaxID=863 RepID=A0A354YXC3_9FIRM|nr:hypothetical protein [Syntrophomonas wolfei]
MWALLFIGACANCGRFLQIRRGIMTEYKQAELFNQSVNEIMEGKTPSQPGDIVEQQLFQLIARLKDTDFSRDNLAQARMRNRLLSRCREKDSKDYKKEGIMKKLFEQHRTVTVFGSLALIFMLTLTLVFPGTVTAVADNVGDNIIKMLKLGKYSTVIQMDDPAPAEKKELTEEQKEQLRKEEAASAKEDENYKVKYASIEEAQKIASFKVQAPDYLPNGYELKEVVGYKGSGDYINLYFKGKGRDIIIRERVMNEHTQFTYGTSGQVDEVDINGVTGALEESNVMWEKDGVSYSLICKGFEPEEALKIARSIK